MNLKASESRTIEQVNKLSDYEKMAADINDAKEEIYKALREFNAMGTSIDDILERAAYIADNEIKQGLLNGSVPYRV